MNDVLYLAADVLDVAAHLGWVTFLLLAIAAVLAAAITLMVTGAPEQPAQDDDWDRRDRQWHYQPDRGACVCEDGDCLSCCQDRHPSSQDGAA